MKEKKYIAIMGAPMVGKAAILRAIASVKKTEVFTFEYESEYIWHTEIFLENKQVTFLTTQGVLFYEKQALLRIFLESSAIVYVLSALKNSIEHQNSHTRQFEKHKLMARVTNKSWDAIPWLIVDNTQGKGVLPPSIDLPHHLKQKIVPLKDYGVQQINHLLQVIKDILLL